MSALRFTLLASFVALASGAGCSCEGPRTATQVLVIVDADEVVRGTATDLHIEVFGGPAEAPPAFPEEPKETREFPVASDDGWPRTLALAPENRDPSRLYRVVATARNSAGDVAVARVISGYVPNDVRVVRLFLSSACDPEECTPTETCDPDLARCVPAEVDPDDLPSYMGDAGTMDASLDGSSFDAGHDGSMGLCPSGCDDGVACTVDVCTATGCEHTPNDALCDDGNECTMDRCGAAACEHPPQPGIACDDDQYCNGLDSCDASGTCTVHAGDPCAGTALTCDEPGRTCAGSCTADGDCPPATMGEFGACEYADGCAETGTQTRTIISWRCVSSRCEMRSSSDTGACSRSTTGVPCGTPSCDPFGPCEVTGGACSMTGEQTRSCRPRACSAGTCSGLGGATFIDTQFCTGPSTEGNSCGTCGRCASESCAEPARCDAGMGDASMGDASMGDAGMDTGPDGGFDAGPDGGFDAGNDAGRDGGSLGFVDSGIVFEAGLEPM